MKEKDLTWDIVNSELKGHRLLSVIVGLILVVKSAIKKFAFGAKSKTD